MGDSPTITKPLLLSSLVLLALMPLGAGNASEDTIVTLATSLPTTRGGMAAASVGSMTYLFGGNHGGQMPGWENYDEILRFDSDNGALAVMGAKLPTRLHGASAVWTGEHAYVFGGIEMTGVNGETTRYLDSVVRYDPATDSIATMTAKLPSGRYLTSAVWDGAYAYVFGGARKTTPEPTDEILRYDPATDTLVVMGAKLPTARAGTAAIWDGTRAYVLGGYDRVTAGTYLGQIVRFDPTTDATSVMSATIPRGYGPAAAYAGRAAYVFGGNNGGFLNTIARFDPTTDTATLMGAQLPGGRFAASATFDGEGVHVFGGSGGAGYAQILAYAPLGGDVDFTSPVLTVPGPMVVDARSLEGTHVSYSASAWDARDGPVAISCLPASGSLFPIGDTLIACEAVDAAGNEASAALLVKVVPRVLGTVTPDGATIPPDEALADGITITTRVALPSGIAVPGAEAALIVTRMTPLGPLDSVADVSTTDANGDATFDVPLEFRLAGSYQIAATVSWLGGPEDASPGSYAVGVPAP